MHGLLLFLFFHFVGREEKKRGWKTLSLPSLGTMSVTMEFYHGSPLRLFRAELRCGPIQSQSALLSRTSFDSFVTFHFHFIGQCPPSLSLGWHCGYFLCSFFMVSMFFRFCRGIKEHHRSPALPPQKQLSLFIPLHIIHTYFIRTYPRLLYPPQAYIYHPNSYPKQRQPHQTCPT